MPARNHTRAVAQFDGSPTYQGKPCPHGHDGMRYASSSACVGCVAERANAKQAEQKKGTHSRYTTKRAVAQFDGDEFYLGRRCPRGHEALRYTATSECVLCAIEAAVLNDEL